jgi:hypothetical protein
MALAPLLLRLPGYLIYQINDLLSSFHFFGVSDFCGLERLEGIRLRVEKTFLAAINTA